MKDAKRIWKARLIVVTVVCALVIPAIALAQGISVLDKGYKAVRLAADTPFPGVNGAAVGADGHLYVSHTGNGTITQSRVVPVPRTTRKPHFFDKEQYQWHRQFW